METENWKLDKINLLEFILISLSRWKFFEEKLLHRIDLIGSGYFYKYNKINILKKLLGQRWRITPADFLKNIAPIRIIDENGD